MQRGELWRAPSPLRDRVLLLVSPGLLIEQAEPMLYAVEAEDQDRAGLLTVPVLVDGTQRWLNLRRGLTRVARKTLTENYGLADRVVLEQVDALLPIVLGLEH